MILNKNFIVTLVLQSHFNSIHNCSENSKTRKRKKANNTNLSMIVSVRSFLFGIILMNSSFPESSFDGSVRDSYRILSRAYNKQNLISKISFTIY